MVTKTLMFFLFVLGWGFAIAICFAIGCVIGYVVGLLAGGILGYLLGFLLKLFSRGRFPHKVKPFAKTWATVFAIIVALVFGISALFEFLPELFQK